MQITSETFGDVVVVHTPDDLMEETSRLLTEAILREPAVAYVPWWP